MTPRWTIHGHAIVSDEGHIADAQGNMPDALRNEVDWARFQAQLDRSVLTVLGRLGHEAHGNPAGRRRMVVSSRVAGLERRDDAWWWNPAGPGFREALSVAAPEGGLVAVPGGRAVFDLVLAEGFDAFHLTRARGVSVPGGVPVFTAVRAGRTPEDVLAAAGLVAGRTQLVDYRAGVETTEWSRPPVTTGASACRRRCS